MDRPIPAAAANPGLHSDAIYISFRVSYKVLYVLWLLVAASRSSALIAPLLRLELALLASGVLPGSGRIARRLKVDSIVVMGSL